MSGYRRRFIANLGDASPFDFGGAIVSHDKYGYHMDYWDAAEGDLPVRGEKHLVYGWDIPENVATEYDWADGAAIAHSTDCDWFALATSANVLDRARATLEIAEFHGPEELDSYPVVLTKSEILRYRPFIRQVAR